MVIIIYCKKRVLVLYKYSYDNGIVKNIFHNYIFNKILLKKINKGVFVYFLFGWHHLK